MRPGTPSTWLWWNIAPRDAEGNVIIHVIEGNNPTSVQRNSYFLNNSQVLGFGACEDVVGTTMRYGNRGDKVLWLQEALHTLGYLEEKHLTGSFGGNTRSAVMEFQSGMEGKTSTVWRTAKPSRPSPLN